ncbi:MAG TPA: helix-turn-helix transcriptional regulator [Micromonosporaceae bacterium]|nr:helix-turn-helix transcriptional regulator [Micromonosporaceae bacterium]
MHRTGLASGSLYPILARLRAAGCVTACWEEIDPVAAGRPARRYYRLTPTERRRPSRPWRACASNSAPHRHPDPTRGRHGRRSRPHWGRRATRRCGSRYADGRPASDKWPW